MQTSAPALDTMPCTSANAGPPLTPLVFRVGVTGHRPDPDKGRALPDVDRLRSTIREILRHILDAFNGVARANSHLFDLQRHSRLADQAGGLRVISALAEGADQWVADEASKLGYELQCPLPFERLEYEKDFIDPAAKAEFNNLLAQATSIMEFDGTRKPSSAAYEAVGRAVLNQTDLLLAVWDGQPPQGRGGTGAVVVEALQRGIPVLWIHWSNPDTWVLRLPEWRLLQRAADIHGDAVRLKELVQDLLLPPKANDDTGRGRPATTRETYFSEGQKCGNFLHGWWAVFLGLVSGALKFGKVRQLFHVANFEEVTVKDWKTECRDTVLDPAKPHAAAPGLGAALTRNYLRHYAWSNRLSVYYGNLYRSAFALCYLLAAAAVFFALLPLVLRGNLIWVIFEFIAIMAILFLAWFGRKHRWHERWIDYRMLAERLRLARGLALFGGGAQPVSMEGHLATYGNPAGTWMHWHHLGVERAAGLPNVRFNEGYLAAIRDFWLHNLIEDQIQYHKTTGQRYAHLEHRLHWIGGVLLAVTLAACGFHFFVHSTWLIVATASLPALGASLAGIRSQAEAQRLLRRCHAMQKALEQLKLDLATIPSSAGQGNSQRFRAVADRVSELMMRETLDWRVVLLDRPLEVHI